jgi:hypothetical protein
MAFPDDGVAWGPGLFRDGNGLGTSPSVGGGIVSSLDSGSDTGAPPESPDGGGPLPPSFDYGWNADYSSSGGLFPAWVTDFGSVDSQILNDQTLFGDSDHAGGFSVNTSGSSSLGPIYLDPPQGRSGKGSGQCSSDGSTADVGRCEMEGYQSFLIAGRSGAGPDAGYQPTQQIPNFPNSNPLGGGAYPNENQMLRFEMIAAKAWSWDATQATFSSAYGVGDITPPVVDHTYAPASDFGNSGGDLNSDPTGSGSVPNLGSGPASVVPEIPPPAMLLIGFAGLALLGSRRLRRSARLG